MKITYFAVALLALIPAFGSQPTPARLTLESSLSTVSNSTLRVTNRTSSPLTITVETGELSEIRVPAGRAIVAPGSAAIVDLGLLRLADGVRILHLKTTARTMEGGSLSGPALYEALRISGGRVEKIAPSQAMPRTKLVEGTSEPGEADLGAGYIDRAPMPAASFIATPMSPGAVVQPLNFPDVERLTTMPLGQLPEVGSISFGATTALRADFPAPETAPVQSLIGPGGGGPEDPWPTATLTGKWFVRTPYMNGEGDLDYKTYPGWAWTAKVWAQQTGSTWKMVGSAPVRTDGGWSVKLINVDPSAQLRLTFEAGNRFVRVTATSGNTYSFATLWKLSSGTNSGSFTGTLSSASRGVYEIFKGANEMWAKFSAHGMSPLRPEPIQMTFPNGLATGQCQTKIEFGITVPWTCASPADGKIWLAAEHALPAVAVHEIAHSVNMYAWGGLPPDAGGDHTMHGCFTSGVALTEGFATFVAYWVQLDRASTQPVIDYFVYNIENKDNACKGQTNETWVSTAFWDTYDTRNDGVDTSKFDTWYYNNPAAPIALYLKTKTLTSMTDFMAAVKQGLPTSFYGEVDKLFRLNTIIQ